MSAAVGQSTLETRFADLSEDEYHADPCETPSLSASIAHVLDSESRLHAWARHPRLGGIRRAPTRSMNLGALSHALMLGAGRPIEIIDAANYLTKAAKAARDEAEEAGKIPVLAKDYEAATVAASALRERFADYGIVLDGQSEVSMLWTERANNGAEVQCRGRTDHIKAATIYDLKSIRSASPAVCRRQVETYGYAIQRAAYVSALERIRPEFAGRVDFVFVFYELAPPYVVTPLRLSGEFRKLGERAWERAIDKWEACLRTNVWPAYVSEIVDLEPNPWTLDRDLERAIAEMGSNENDLMGEGEEVA